MELQGAFSSVEKSIVVAWLVGALVVALATLAVSLPELGPKALKRWKLWATVVFVSGIVPVWLFVLAALWYFGLFPPFMGSEALIELQGDFAGNNRFKLRFCRN